MDKVQKHILKQIKEEKYVLTAHTRIRMNQRLLADADIINLAETTTSIVRQESNDAYLLNGKSTWGEKLSLSVAVRENIIIVTIFYEE